MRTQIMLEGGPFAGHMFGHVSAGVPPTEIRVASGDKERFLDEKVECAVYRRLSLDRMPVSLLYHSSYEFLGMRESSPWLVQVWLKGAKDEPQPTSEGDRDGG